MAASWSATGAGSFPLVRQRRGRAPSGPGMASRAAGSYLCHTGWWKAVPATRPSIPGRTTAHAIACPHQKCHSGGPRRASRLAGRRCRRAYRRGLSLRAIARQLGISRNTVRRHVAADSPPVYPIRRNEYPPGRIGAGLALLRDGTLTESLATNT